MANSADQKLRCGWSLSGNDPLYVSYHDKEWGVPVHDDKKLFEFLVLEGAQAGLSWFTVLRRREAYREAFDDFDIESVSNYDSRKVSQLLKNKAIIRNKLKIMSAIQNAKAILKIRDEFGSFDNYIWNFVPNYKPLKNKRKYLSDIPATSKESDLLSKDLYRRGLSFVGSTICYAHMQATGMVNDHLVSCFRYDEV
jgi:DNA-3-methyladenine glycosylase I